MSADRSLSVNGVPIQLDYFVGEYVEHVACGIIGSLRNTGEVKTLILTIDDKGQVKIILNGAHLPIKYFVEEIILSTLAGLIAPLKGVDKEKPLQSLEIKIAR